MKVLIVDDEHPARKKIASFLRKRSEVKQIIEASNGKEAVDIIKKGNPDIVLLDIQMPGMNGFKVIEEIGASNMPLTIFVTAYDQYALNAFEVSALDYLLKPFDKERFYKSFDRAVERLALKQNSMQNIEAVILEMKKENYIERILVSAGIKHFFIPVREIIYISSAEKYVELNTLHGKYLLRETMNNIAESLNPKHFTRIHRSYIINIEEISEMQPWTHGDYIVVMKNGKKLQMSRRFKDRLLSNSTLPSSKHL